MSLTPAELAAARLFRETQRAVLEHKDPPDITASVYVRHERHDCAARGGKSVFLELREHYVFSPEYWVCYCSKVAEKGLTPDGWFPHEDCQGSKPYVPAKRFGWIFTEGRCPACGMIARSGHGRLVDPAIRPPAEHAIVT